MVGSKSQLKDLPDQSTLHSLKFRHRSGTFGLPVLISLRHWYSLQSSVKSTRWVATRALIHNICLCFGCCRTKFMPVKNTPISWYTWICYGDRSIKLWPFNFWFNPLATNLRHTSIKWMLFIGVIQLPEKIVNCTSLSMLCFFFILLLAENIITY